MEHDRVGRLTAVALRSLELFRDLPETEVERVSRVSTWQRVAEREQVVHAGEGAMDDVLVVEGVVGVAVTAAGRDFVATIVSAGEFLPHPLLPGAPDLPVHAEALTDRVLVYRLPEPAVSGQPSVRVAVHAALDREAKRQLEYVSAALSAFALFDAQTRFARMLGRVALHLPGAELPFTHEVLGRMSGLRRAQATDFLGLLRARGLIAPTHHRHGVRVLAPERLAVAQSILDVMSEI